MEEAVVVASGLCISQLLVMPQAAVYPTEAGVLAGVLGGDIVEEMKVEVIGWFAGYEVEMDVLEFLLWQPRQGHEPEGRLYGFEWRSTHLICSSGPEFECSNSAMASSADMSWALIPSQNPSESNRMELNVNEPIHSDSIIQTIFNLIQLCV